MLPETPIKSESEAASLVVTKIGTIGNEDVVHKLEAHDATGLPDAFRKVVVGRAGTQAA